MFLISHQLYFTYKFFKNKKNIQSEKTKKRIQCLWKPSLQWTETGFCLISMGGITWVMWNPQRLLLAGRGQRLRARWTLVGGTSSLSLCSYSAVVWASLKVLEKGPSTGAKQQACILSQFWGWWSNVGVSEGPCSLCRIWGGVFPWLFLALWCSLAIFGVPGLGDTSLQPLPLSSRYPSWAGLCVLIVLSYENSSRWVKVFPNPRWPRLERRFSYLCKGENRLLLYFPWVCGENWLR